MVKVNQKKNKDILKLNIILIMFMIIFCLVFFLRFNFNHSLPEYDSVVFFNEYIDYVDFKLNSFNIFYDIILELSFLINQISGIIVFLFIIGLLNLILFNKLAEILLGYRTAVIATLIFLFSNIYLYSIFVFSFTGFFIFLFLSMSYLIIKKKDYFLIPLLVSFFLSLQAGIVLMILAFMLILNFNKNKLKLLIIPFILVIILVLNHNYFNSVAIMLSENKYNFFYIFYILAIFGLFKSNKRTILATISIFVLSMFNVYMKIIFLIVALFFIANSIMFLFERKWFIKSLKIPVIFFLILIVAYHSIHFSSLLIKSEPNKLTFESLKSFEAEILKLNMTNKQVLCDPKTCEYVKYFTKLHPIEKEEYNNLSIFFNGDESVLMNYLKIHNISSIILSKSFINKNWDVPDSGILLLLSDLKEFKRIINSDKYIGFAYILNTTENNSTFIVH